MTSNSPPPVRGKAKRGVGTLDFNQVELPGLPTHGVVPVTMLPDPLTPLKVEIKNSPDIIALDQIQLHWNNSVPGEGIGVIRDVTSAEAADPNFVFEMELPVDVIPDLWEYGVNRLEYEVGDIFAGSGAMSGKPLTVIFDRVIPGGEDPPAVLTFTDEQAHEITEDDLVNDKLPVVAQVWYDMRVGDVLTPWLGTGPTEAEGAYVTPMPPVAAGEDHKQFDVTFDRADMEALGNKELFFAYKVEDLAGNVSKRSIPIHAFVFLASPPTGLLAPVIPAAADDNLVTEAETRPTDLDIEIPFYTNASDDQEIIVVWGGIDMPAVPLDSTHIPGNPPDPLITIQLSYADVVKAGVKVSGLAVQYKVKVGTTVVAQSPVTTIDVDLTTPGGQPDPDPGTPEHEDLGKLTLTSASGGPVNTIPSGDFDKPAEITIPRLGSVSSQPVWLLGDEVIVTYKTTDLPPVTISGTNEGDDLKVPLTPDIIAAVGPGSFYSNYRIVRALGTTPPQFGTAHSLPTQVSVYSSADYPNDGNTLRQVEFPEQKLVQGNYYIQRKEGRDGTPVHVPVNYSNVVAGNTIDLRFVGITGFNNPGGNEIADTEVKVTHPITEADLLRGYAIIPIEAEILLTICNRNGSNTNYTITNGSGPTNSVDRFMNIAVQHKDPNWACIFPVPPDEP